MTITSRPGAGTTVTLMLPATDRPAVAPEPEATAPRGREARGTALLVDDEDLVRESTADMLTEIGYRVVEATSAEEALGLIDGGLRFELLVTDHLMPGMSGVELIRAVRAKTPGLPALIISGYADADSIAPDLPRLTKPFRQFDLAASLKLEL
jgi:CheY-like chemotaxis protein